MYDIDYRIPLVDLEALKAPHYQIPLDRQSPFFDEGLVDLRDYGVPFLSWHALGDGRNAPYRRRIEGSRSEGWLRKSLAEKLARANLLLRPFGAELLILDAYRTIECQRGLWAFFRERGRQENPEANDEALRRYALRFVRDPSHFDAQDSRTFGVHSTGSAIDVVLRNRASGSLLNMGTAFDDYAESSVTDYFERLLLLGAIDANDERLWNRRLLHWAMKSEDLTNDPILYWHHDWGNQAWIKIRRAVYGEAPDSAWYGYVPAPPRTAAS